MTGNQPTKGHATSTTRHGRHTQPVATTWRVFHVCTVLAVMALLTGAVLATLDTAAYAAPPAAPPTVGVSSLDQVINNIRVWLFGLLVAVATLFLTIGGVRLMWANGDPGEAEKGKAALRSAAIGYGLALLAPLIVTIVGSWVR
jgi:succinate dehydrogenase/fumarate reductase cytochrome b subunit